MPHRAFRQVQKKGYTWLGLLLYISSTLLGAYVLTTGRDPDLWPVFFRPLHLWVVFFHPLQVGLQSLMADVGLTLPIWPKSLLLFAAVDIAVVSMFFSVFGVAARAMFEADLGVRKICTAVFLVLGVTSLLAWPLFSTDGIMSFIQDESLSAVLLVAFWFVFIVYLTIALVVIGDFSTLKALGLLIVGLILLPVWLVGVMLNLIPFLSPQGRRCRWVTLASGIILRPHTTFQRIEAQRPLHSAVGLYVISASLLVGAAWLSSHSPDEEVLAPPTLWAFLFHKPQLILSFFILKFDLDYGHVQTTFQALPWYLYLYLVVASVTMYVASISAIHLTIQRLMDASGNFKHLLSSHLYVSNSATLFLFPYPLVAWWLIDSDRSIMNDELFISFFILTSCTFLIWSALLHVLAIKHVYRLQGGRPLGAWFTSMVLFVPVTVLTVLLEAGMEVPRPFRIRAFARRLQRLHRMVLSAVARGQENAACTHMDRLLEHYGEDTDIARRARLKVDLIGPLRTLFRIAPESILTALVGMAQHRETDIRNVAAQALKAMLDDIPERLVSGYYFLLTQNCPPDLFGRLRELPGPTPATQLGAFLYTMLAETNDRNLTAHLARGEALLAGWRDRPHGEDLYLIYRALHALSGANTVVDLERADGALGAALNVQDPILTTRIGTFKPLLDISHYLAYYQRTEFENKVPYLAAPIMLLVDEARRLEKQHFPPEDAVLRLLITRLQDIILREFDGLRGRADLRCELRPQRAPFGQEVPVVLYVRNQGSAVAERVQVQLEVGHDDGFTLAHATPVEVGLLSPKREVRLEFDIRPLETGRIRVPFRIDYDDLEKKQRSLPFAGLIELYEHNRDMAEEPRSEAFSNPYITGLPVKDPTMFFGREEVFRFIRQHLEGRHEKNIIVLRGQRRTGKTSILYQLEHHVDEKYIPVLLDLQGYTSTGVERFLYWMARGIVRATAARGFELAMPTQAEFRDDPYAYFRDTFLPEAWQAIGYHHLLLAFDEFEELAARVQDGKLDKDILPYMRNLMQHTTQLDFICAGTYKLQQITHEYWSILFNIALFKDVGFMKPDEVAQMLREPVKGFIFYDDLAIEKITGITAGHPYFVQLLGNKLVDFYLEQEKFYLTLQDVNQVLRDVIESGALHFDYLWNESSPTEQLLLAALARIISREGGEATLADIAGLLDGPGLILDQESILAAVKSLMVRELILTDADFRRYEFKIDLVRLWLERYQRFGVVVDAYRQDQPQPL